MVVTSSRRRLDACFVLCARPPAPMDISFGLYLFSSLELASLKGRLFGEVLWAKRERKGGENFYVHSQLRSRQVWAMYCLTRCIAAYVSKSLATTLSKSNCLGVSLEADDGTLRMCNTHIALFVSSWSQKISHLLPKHTYRGDTKFRSTLEKDKTEEEEYRGTEYSNSRNKAFTSQTAMFSPGNFQH